MTKTHCIENKRLENLRDKNVTSKYLSPTRLSYLTSVKSSFLMRVILQITVKEVVLSNTIVILVPTKLDKMRGYQDTGVPTCHKTLPLVLVNFHESFNLKI